MLARLRAKAVAAGLAVLALTACASVPEPEFPEVWLNIKRSPVVIFEDDDTIYAVYCGQGSEIVVKRGEKTLVIRWAYCAEA